MYTVVYTYLTIKYHTIQIANLLRSRSTYARDRGYLDLKLS